MMKETIFVKYNRTRKEEFQIRTSIIEEEGKRWVEKTALTAAASSHIQSLKEKKEQLKQCYQNIEAADVTVSADGRTARFPFIKGETLAEILGRQIKNGQAPVCELNAAMDKVFSVSDGPDAELFCNSWIYRSIWRAAGRIPVCRRFLSGYQFRRYF